MKSPSSQKQEKQKTEVVELKQAKEALKQSEERLLLALHGGKSGVWEWDLRTGNVWWSPEMYTLWGVKRGTPMTSKNALSLVDEQDVKVIRKELSSRKDSSFNLREFRIHHPDLGLRWMEARSKVIVDTKTNTKRIMGITFDITERKKIEDSLRESEEKFRAVFDQTTIAMSLADTKANWLAFNKAYPKMFGYTEKELRTMHPKELLHPDDMAKSSEEFLRLIKGEITSLVQERRYIHKNGSLIYGVVRSTVIKSKTGDPDYIVTVIENITDRKLAEQELQKREERFRTLIEQSTDVIQLLNAEGNVLYTSDSLTRVLGYTPDEIMGKGGKPYIHPEDLPKFYKEFAKLLERPGNQITLEYRLKHKNGSWIWVEATGVNHLENPAVRAIVGNFRDITQRKQLEKQKDEFLGIASHELKTPVTSLKAYAQILQRRFEKDGDDKASAMLLKMDGQINKLTNLIQDLLDVSKVESGKLVMHKSVFNIDELIGEVVEEIQRTTETHTIVVKGKSGKMIFADRDRVGQVLTNFLTNAVKYSPEETKIVITIKNMKNSVTISVQDFGIGIAKEHLPFLFDRFFRVSGTVQETIPGMGLGLNIAAEIIRRHEGKVWVESEVGKGSTFSFSLPVQEEYFEGSSL